MLSEEKGDKIKEYFIEGVISVKIGVLITFGYLYLTTPETASVVWSTTYSVIYTGLEAILGTIITTINVIIGVTVALFSSFFSIGYATITQNPKTALILFLSIFGIYYLVTRKGVFEYED